MTRGLALGLLNAIAITAVAQLTVWQATDVDFAKAVAIALLVGAAALWSAIDAWLRRRDRGRNWVIAALVAGPVAGLFSVIGRALFVDQTGVNALSEALTGGAAFVALLVLVPAGLGLFVGGRLLSPRGGPSRGDRGRRGRSKGNDGAGAVVESGQDEDERAGAGSGSRRAPSPRPRS